MREIYKRADGLAATGRAAESRRRFFEALSLAPENAVTYIRWANLEASVRDKHEAMRLLLIAREKGFTHWKLLQDYPAFRKVLLMKSNSVLNIV